MRPHGISAGVSSRRVIWSFFHTLGRRRAVTHVGVYLRNNKFIHASVSGVMISDLGEGYYEKHFIGAGRVLDIAGQWLGLDPVGRRPPANPFSA